MKIKELFSDNLSLLGFLTNLGLVTSAYVIFYILGDFVSLKSLSNLNQLNIFSIIYLILLGITYKWGLEKVPIKLKAGFVLSIITVALVIALTYLRLFF